MSHYGITIVMVDLEELHTIIIYFVIVITNIPFAFLKSAPSLYDCVWTKGAGRVPVLAITPRFILKALRNGAAFLVASQ